MSNLYVQPKVNAETPSHTHCDGYYGKKKNNKNREKATNDSKNKEKLQTEAVLVSTMLK